MLPLGFGGYGLYLLVSLPALLLGLWAQARVRGTFNKFSRVPTPNGAPGAEIARRVLDANGLAHVGIEQSRGGMLSDHYDPRSKVLRLSEAVFSGRSMAAAGVAAHEAGHALQHAKGYAPLQLRSALVPGVQFGSWLGPIIFFVGLLIQNLIGTTLIAWVGLGLFGLTAVFTLVTLPVEIDASRRAKQELVANGIVFKSDMEGVNRVLNAAALTYVAAAIQAITTVLYYAYILMGRRR